MKQTLGYKNLVIIIIMTLNLAGFARNSQTIHDERSRTIDSLKNIIATAGHDTTKVKALNSLAREFFGTDPEEALEYSQQAAELAESIEYDLGKAGSYDNLGRYYWMTSDFPKSIEYSKKKLKIYEKLNNHLGTANSYTTIGLIYDYKSNYPLALEYYFKSLKIQEQFADKEGMAASYSNIGIIYDYQLDYQLALDYYLKSLEIKEELGDIEGIAKSYENIGIIYANQLDFRHAMEYFNKSLKLKEELGDKLSTAKSYNNIGFLYTSLFEEGHSFELAGLWAVQNPGQLLDTAMYYQHRALSINKELNDEYNMIFSLSGIAHIYFKREEYGEALTYYQEAALLGSNIGALQQESKAHAGAADCWEKLGNYQRALAHYKQYTVLNDSIYNEEKSKDLGKLEAKHEFETAEAERKRMEQEQAKQEATAKSRRDNLQYSGILIFIVLLFTGVFMLGKFSIPIRLAEGMIFFAFLLFFEFSLVMLDPYIEQYSSGAPAIKLGFNAVLAALIFPAHSFFESKMKGRLVKK